MVDYDISFINKNGKMFVKIKNKCFDLEDFCKKYGTPLDVEFLPVIDIRMKKLFQAFAVNKLIRNVNTELIYLYPLKVNPRKEILERIIGLGKKFKIGLEIGNEYELELVIKNFEKKLKEKIIVCHGIKSKRYVELISGLLKKGFKITPVIEDPEEIKKLKNFEKVGIRINSGNKDRFGVLVKDIENVCHKLKKYVMRISIIHFHIGSQITDIQIPLKKNLKKMMKVLRYFDSKGCLDSEIILDLGGGLSVSKKSKYDEKTYFRIIHEGILSNMEFIEKFEKLYIGVESGRWVIAPSQITLFKIESTKRNDSKYIIDGSFISDLPDTWGINEEWEILPVNNLDKKMKKVILEGKTCDNDDIYIRKISLPNLSNNNKLFICVKNTGAYQETLGNHHCSLPDSNKVIIHDIFNNKTRIKFINRKSVKHIESLFGYE